MLGRVRVGFDGSADARSAVRMAMAQRAALDPEVAAVPVVPVVPGWWWGPAVLVVDDSEGRR